MARNISDEIDFDKELQVFLFEGSKSDVWESLVSLPQVENAQNLYPNFSFIIVIVFTVIQVFHYCPALLFIEGYCSLTWRRTHKDGECKNKEILRAKE